jgi:short-subunit dehydrogenase
MPRFTGQVVLITGASSGIGAALAREFARQGAEVALSARRADRIDTLAAELTRGGGRAIAIPCDVTVDGDVERAVARTREAFGRVDVVVANAGYSVRGALERLRLDDYRRQFETNVFGVLRTVYAALADLRQARGVLLLVGSVSGHVATPGVSAYAMSKFAVRALAEAVGPELARYGVAVVLVSPGFVESEIGQVDNAGVFRAEHARDAPSWLIMPTATAARQIVRAVAHRRREVVITGHGKVAVFLARHAPRLLAAVMRRFAVSRPPEPSR